LANQNIENWKPAYKFIKKLSEKYNFSARISPEPLDENFFDLK
jgi:hypothetical protein